MRSKTIMLFFAWVAVLEYGNSFGYGVEPIDKGQVEAALEGIADYHSGAGEGKLVAVENLIRETQSKAEMRETIRQQLSAMLTREMTPEGRMFVCRQLWFLGAQEAIPSLAEMLQDEKTADMACYAIGQDPSPAMGALLREALTKVKGKSQIAIINLLGERRDSAAAEPISRLAFDSNAQISLPAVAAMGKIGGETARQTLVKARSQGNEDIKIAATHAYLEYAQGLMVHDQSNDAVSIYEELLKKEEPTLVRVAALRGLAAVRDVKAMDRVLAALGENDIRMQRAAIVCLREMSGEEVVDAVNANFSGFTPSIQAQLIDVLADRNVPAARTAVTNLTKSKEQEVRVAALGALSKIGDVSSTGLLIEAAVNADRAEERTAAQYSLRMLNGSEVDSALIRAMKEQSPKNRVIFINILSDRNVYTAVPSLLVEASSQDPSVSQAAFKALAWLADGSNSPAMVELLANLNNESVRPTAERAVVKVSCKAGKGSKKSQPTVDAYEKTQSSTLRCSFLRVLGGIGTNQSRDVLEAALKDPDAGVRDTAVRELANWTDPEVLDTLMNIVKTTDNETHRALTLRGYIRLMTYPDRKRTLEQTLECYRWALSQARRPEELRSILSGLSRISHPDSLQLVMPLVKDEQVQMEACQAAEDIASEIDDICPEAARIALEQVRDVVKDDDLRQRAERILKKIVKHSNRYNFDSILAVSLFDGKTLAGWEAKNPSLFRVEDGAIVAGTMKEKIPNNEFICTEKTYGNFELTLQVKLLGDPASANAGIQIRSRRVPSSFEMRGFQADMGQTQWACLYDESRRSRVLAMPDPAELSRVLRLGDWNDYRIRCTGRRIQFWLNEAQMVDYMESEPEEIIDQKGIIGLQIHAGPPSEAWYRNIMIKEIK